MDRSPRRAARTAAPLLCLAFAACFTSIGKWTYPSGRWPTTRSSRAANAFVLVHPLLDARSAHNVSSMAFGYVPLFPLGWSEFDRPEATVHGEDTTEYHGEPCFDLPRAVVAELLRQGLATRAEFSSDFATGRGETHVLRGTLRSFRVAESRITYGLSIYAPVLWALALPMGTSANDLCVDFELVEAATGRVVWAERVHDSDFHVEGWYYGPEWYRFGWLFERRLREKLGGLATALGAEPAPLPEELRREIEAVPARLPDGLGVDAAKGAASPPAH